MNEIRNSIVNGSFKPKKNRGIPTHLGSGKGLGVIGNLYGDNFDEVIIEMIKKHYLYNQNYEDLLIMSKGGISVTKAALVVQGYKLPTLPIVLKRFINVIERNAEKFVL